MSLIAWLRWFRNNINSATDQKTTRTTSSRKFFFYSIMIPPVHKSRTIKTWINELGVDLDLNFTGHLWDELGWRLRARTSHLTPDFINALQAQIRTETVQNLVDDLPVRFWPIITSKGGQPLIKTYVSENNINVPVSIMVKCSTISVYYKIPLFNHVFSFIFIASIKNSKHLYWALPLYLTPFLCLFWSLWYSS